jgi:hypothetical protein
MCKFIIGLGFGFLLAAATWAQVPNYDYPCLMTNLEGYLVNGNIYSNPTFGDWDGDGTLDLMVGVFYNGNLWYYHNTAASGQIPIFEAHTVVMADGDSLAVSYD